MSKLFNPDKQNSEHKNKATENQHWDLGEGDREGIGTRPNTTCLPQTPIQILVLNEGRETSHNAFLQLVWILTAVIQ